MAQEYGIPFTAEASEHAVPLQAEPEAFINEENAGDPYNPPSVSQRKPARTGSVASSFGSGAGISKHEASRAKKAAEVNAKAIQNRIRFFQREEEKIWRDLEEVRRQATTIEEGRTRTLEKKLADKTIQQERGVVFQQNRCRAATTKSAGQDQRKHIQMLQDREKRLAAEDQRQLSKDIVRRKREQEAQARLGNSQRAVGILSSRREAKQKVQEDRAAWLERLRLQHEAERQAAEAEVYDAEAQLPQLEAEEMACLQRLQNSRIVTQSVLEELESSLGKQSAVTSLLRSKQRGAPQDPVPSSGFTATATGGGCTLSAGSAQHLGTASTEAPLTPEQVDPNRALR